MSVRESSNAFGDVSADRDTTQRFTRWPGLLSLVLGVLLGPTIALINQEGIYAANMWSCGHGTRATMHIVPALCLAVAMATALMAYRDWRAVGAGVEDENATVETRTRFLSLLGITISVFSSLVIIAQWAAIFVFDPCMRA
jgi:hypothetical protein